MTNGNSAALAPTTPAVAPHPHRTAMLTVVAWNFLPVLMIVYAVVATLRPEETGEDWSGVVAAVLIILGGVGVLLGAGAGLIFAVLMVARRMKGAAVSGVPVTAWSAILSGSGAAALGWIVTVAVGGAFLMLMSVLPALLN